MKKAKLLLLLAATFIFGCQKENVLKPITDKVISESKLPAYNEHNSEKVTWEQLPEKLRNAVKITTEQAPSAISANFRFPIGPWGGYGGNEFRINPVGTNDKIYAIAITTSGVYIDGLIIFYQKPDGAVYLTGAASFTGTFYINYFASDEYMNGIGGRFSAYINRLTIYTNYRTFSYGGSGGAPFYASAGPGNQILGFFGRAGSLIDRIGANVYSR